MESIKKYVEKFMSKVKVNRNYDMNAEEWIKLAISAERDSLDTVITAFHFGYAKGYRAALAEMKKGGATA